MRTDVIGAKDVIIMLMFGHFLDIFHRHQHWHKAGFSEIAELYIAITLRALALSLVGIFIPVFLYREGYSVADISLFYMVTYSIRFITDPIVAKISVKVGLHFMISISYIFIVILLLLLLLVPDDNLPLSLIGIVQGLSLGCFYIPFNIDLSAYSHKKNAGKELSSLTIFQKIAGALGPLAGGYVATKFGISYTLLLAIFVLIVASAVIMSKSTSQKKRFQYSYKITDYWKYRRYFTAGSSFSLIKLGGEIVWPLLIAITVINNDNVYVQLGLITTISVALAVVSAHLFGKLIDKNKSRPLKYVASSVLAIVNIARLFASNIIGVLSLNMISEPATSLSNILFDKGILTSAEAGGRERSNVVVTVIFYSQLTRVIVWSCIYVFATNYSDIAALKFALAVSAAGSMMFATKHFEALR